MQHKLLQNESIHTPFRWIFADAATRLAESVVADDVMKFAYQEDTETVYVLKDLTPTWVAITSGAGVVNDLPDLGDVNISGLADGEILQYNLGTGYWENAAGVNTLDSLTDVNAPTPSGGEVLAYNAGGYWENAAVSLPLNDLTDVNTPAPTNGQVLTYNTVSGYWEAQTPGSAGGYAHTVTDTYGNATSTAVQLIHESSVAPSTGFGVNLDLQTKYNTNVYSVARVSGLWSTYANNGAIAFYAYNGYAGGVIEVGYINSTPVPTYNPTVARGVGAFDFQHRTGGTTYVASGAYSTIFGGFDHLAAAPYGNIFGGRGNTVGAGGQNVGIFGGRSNTITSGQYSFIGPGRNNSISIGLTDKYAFVFGGSNSVTGVTNHATISGESNQIDNTTYGSILNGLQNIIANYGSHGLIGGGYFNQVQNSNYATILNGRASQIGTSNYALIGSAASPTSDIQNSNYGTILNGKGSRVSYANYGMVSGGYALAESFGQFATANGKFSVQGDAQGTIQAVVRNSIIHSTGGWYELFLDGIGERYKVANNSTHTVSILIVGTDQGAHRWSYRIDGVVDNTGGTVTTPNWVVTTIYETDANFNVRIWGDTPNQAMRIDVTDTGASGRTVYWVATIRTVETKW